MPVHKTSHFKYRPDIDGLRALAVISVICFHVFPEVLKGGFIGVDIFFVISGFLISSIIFQALEKGQFSFYDFYSRRIKRIFPALFVVLLFTYIGGAFFMLSHEQAQLGKHILGSAGFVANLINWQEAGYFDVAAETKPLLHIWSLGVEEQFYLLWPFLLFFLWNRVNITILITCILLASFAFSIVCINTDIVAAFFSPFARFWELMAGSILAHTVSSDKYHIQNHQKNYLSIFGLLFLLLGILFIDKSVAFPGWYALIPTLGAMCLIQSGPLAIANRVLSSRILVNIGLISYPLYLYHWPLLAFHRLLYGQSPSTITGISIITISFLLSYITWKLIEIPIKKRKNPIIIFILIILMISISVVGYRSYSTQEDPINSLKSTKGMNLLISK